MTGIARIPEMSASNPVEYRLPLFLKWFLLDREIRVRCICVCVRGIFVARRWLGAGLIYPWKNEEEEERRRETSIESNGVDGNMYVYMEDNGGGKFHSSWRMGKTEEHRCNFFAVRLRALGFDGMRCVIECNHNNVPFGMLSKVHRCINKMHLILNGRTGERNPLLLPFPRCYRRYETYRGMERGGKIFANAMISTAFSSPWGKEIPRWKWVSLKEGRKEEERENFLLSKIVEKLSTIFIVIFSTILKTRY